MRFFSMLCVTAVLLFAACDSSTIEPFTYFTSPHVEPDSVISSNNKTLVLRVKSVRPENCWELDHTLYGFSNDTLSNRQVQFRTWVSVSLKKKQNAVCAPVVDTLRSTVSIKYDSAATYILRFDQTDARGNYVERTYSYKVTD